MWSVVFTTFAFAIEGLVSPVQRSIGSMQSPSSRQKRRHWYAVMSTLVGAHPRYAAQRSGIGIDVLSLSNGVLIRIPATLTFNSGSAEIAPQIRATLHELARTLKTQPQSFVDVYAHSDTTGTPAVNTALSDRRASAVAAFLASDGVGKARIASRGFGESAPLYFPDDSEMKQAANRRVEIRLVPFTG